MLYITGIQALNIEDSTECCGDWHTSAQDWSKLNIADSEKSRFKEDNIRRIKANETSSIYKNYKQRYYCTGK